MDILEVDLDLNQTDLEHVMGFNNIDNGIPTDDDKRLRENINNFILTGSNKNQTKVDKGMDDWFDTEVHKLDDSLMKIFKIDLICSVKAKFNK